MTIYGVTVLTLMMVSYALENRHRHYVLAFSGFCVLSGVYGFLSGVWPFGAVEIIWSAVAFRRWLNAGAPSIGT
jgi:hypothetical protein